MAFESLSDKLQAVFKKLRGKGKLSESDIKEVMREIRLALMEADVNYKVVRDFVKTVSERAVGAEVMESLGCVSAYNLDGGGSSTRVFMGEVVNNPTTGGSRIKERSVSDIVYIG